MKTHRIGPYTATHECPGCSTPVHIGPKIETHTLEEWDNGTIKGYITSNALNHIEKCELADAERRLFGNNTEYLLSDTEIECFVEHDQHFAGMYKGKFYCSDGCLYIAGVKIVKAPVLSGVLL